jgi:rod shape-determining protein MreD
MPVAVAELLFGRPLKLLAALLPFLSAAVLVVVANLPFSLTDGLLPAPVLALGAVYFWGLMRRDLMSPAIVLVLGLLEDFLSGGPPGLWASGFLSAYAFIDRQRETLAGLSEFGGIIGFAGATVLAALSVYGLATIVFWRLPPPAPLLLVSVVTVLFYPLVAIPLNWMQRQFVGRSRGED